MSWDGSNLTQLLRDGGTGDRASFDQAILLVYDELRRLARYHLSHQRPGHTLQPTDMVHAAYVRLVSRSQPAWQDRVHFFRVAAGLMRQILVDHARAKCASKRGGGATRIELKDDIAYTDEKAADLVAIHDALKELESVHARKAQTLELKYFGGLKVEEIADALGTSVATVGRDIRLGEAWIRRRLARCAASDDDG